ncbi:serine hydrolase [uncultured Dokdonia sp.]|mgnify:CR=1 FL=1|uniref:serine hydrolase domain-containing protein n=1 Tax=uncultured Dokdonia sp. TaxID=575653 RepID=UPI0030EE4B1E|tara:strand:+ start:1843 stop:3009 length:1167 start_codon:yes stop_codon:yes gene_type:complete
MRRTFKIILKLGVLLLLILGIFIVINYTLLKRVVTYPANNEISSTEWYTPKAIIKGDNSTNYTLSDSLTIDKTVLEEISSYAENQNSNALLVLHRGKLQLEKYYNQTTKESTSNSMSMAKTITSILIGIAIDEGYIESEKELVSAYITDWQDDQRNTITIEDLLLMQSGLRVDNNVQNIFSDVIGLYMGTDVESTALKIPLSKVPATAFEYNNANTQLLAIILEKTTGLPIEQYASSRLWKPIGAADAGWWLDKEGGMPRTFCCYFAQAEDWMIIGQLLLQNGEWRGKQVIPEKWISKMLTQSTLERDYGYQIWLNYESGGNREKDRKSPFLAKNFLIDGTHNQEVIVVPQEEIVLVRIGEKPTSWDESFMINKILTSLNRKKTTSID